MLNARSIRESKQNDKVRTWLHYTEYKSKLLKIACVPNLKVRYERFIELIEDPVLFQPPKRKDDNSYNTWIIWTNQRNLLMKIINIGQYKLNIRFIASKSGQLTNVLTELNIDVNKNRVEAIKHPTKEPWVLSDLYDIANDFYELFPDDISLSTEREATEFIFPKTLNQFELAQKIIHYQNRNITTRMQKILQSIPNQLNGSSIFWLNWHEKSLKVIISNAPYESYLFSEKELFNRFYPNETFSYAMRYYQIKIIEQEQDHQTQILKCWSTLEALVLEVYELDAGSTIKGTEVLGILQEFIRIIQPKNIFLQDSSKVTIPSPDSNEEIVVPLRLSKMLMKKNTWYGEQLDVTPLDVDHLQSAWSENVELTQCSATFYKSANDLRSLSFNVLLKLWKEDRSWLLLVAKKYFSKKTTEELTAKDIFNAIFNRDNLKTSQGFADIKQLQKHLNWSWSNENIHRQDRVEDHKVTISNKTLKYENIKTPEDILQRIECIMNTRFYGLLFPRKKKEVEKRVSVEDKSHFRKRAKLSNR